MGALKVAVIPGIATGHRPWSRFKSHLRSAGYEIVTAISDADIIVAHSAGCFWLPQAPTKQKLLLIDPPYWPGRSVRNRTLARFKSNVQFRKYGYSFKWWLKRNIIGLYTVAKEINHTRNIVRHAHFFDLPEILTNHRAILVRNHDDDWLTPDIDHLLKQHPGLTIVNLPGDHEDCLHSPDAYVKLFKTFL